MWFYWFIGNDLHFYECRRLLTCHHNVNRNKYFIRIFDVILAEAIILCTSEQFDQSEEDTDLSLISKEGLWKVAVTSMLWQVCCSTQAHSLNCVSLNWAESLIICWETENSNF